MPRTALADSRSPKLWTQRELVAELRKLYSDKGIRRDVFGRRAALPSEIAAWMTEMRRRESGHS